jgi:hypothetical protein
MVGRKIKQQEQLLRLGAENWEDWRKDGTWKLHQAASLEEISIGNSAYLILPARCVIAVPLWLPKTDPLTAKQMVEVELEIRGLLSKQADSINIRTIKSFEDRMLICAQVFPLPFPEQFQHPAFGYFNASPLVANLNRDTLHLWQEGSDIVAVFTYEESPIYWETVPLTTPELFTWLECIWLPLMEEEFLGTKIDFLNFLDLNLTTPTFCSTTLKAHPSSPRAPLLRETLPSCDWKSPQRRSVEKARKTRKTIVQTGLAVGGLCLFFIAAFWTWVGFRHFQANRLAQKIKAIEPEIHVLLATQRRWNELAPTIEASGFPVELLRSVVEQMPPEGMWLTQFEFDNQKVNISGEASTVSVAAQFFTSLNRAQMQWEMPPPALLSNNRARFVISGKP